VRRVEGKTLFSLDHTFGGDSSTREIYDEIVRPIVWATTEGKHGTVFCYGQTGSGKTYTMQGDDTRVRVKDGVLQLALKDIFRWNTISQMESAVKISYIEIYNEQVRDLLSGVVPEEDLSSMGTTGTKNGTVLSVRDDPKLGVQVNCSVIQVKDVDTALEMLQFGNHHRQVASTNMNARSSRSHAIFRITIETKTGAGLIRAATLNLVDLAGSENSHTAGTAHVRQREGGTINKSLLSLSKVINSLSMPPGKRPRYISYRDSKLTFILQPHLSGNALMAVLCCVSPAATFVEETRSTLRFAARAKLVETKAEVNQLMDVDTDKEVVQQLNVELGAARKALEEIERRSVVSQQASSEAAEELRKIKKLIFGDETFELETLGDPAFRKKLNKRKKVADSSIPTIDETRGSEYTDNVMVDQNTTLSAISYQRVTSAKMTDANRPRPPPSEVLIMTGEPQQYNNLSPQYAADMEQRAKFLEHRLEATEDVVDALRKDLKSARSAIHQLVHKNVRLASKVERLHRKRDDIVEQESSKRRGQYILLKWSMYLSLFFSFFQLQDLFIVMVMFVWLSLESYTASTE
jgi:centromeric protein E